MTEKPVYRWEIRRAAKARRQNLNGGISTHDLVILAVVMAMLVIVLRFILIFGGVSGMDVGPFQADVFSLTLEHMHYAGVSAVTDSFHKLKYISGALLIYWAAASWSSFFSPTVSLSTKLFKSTIGAAVLLLFASSFFPENAVYLAEIWFEPAFGPVVKS